MAAASTIICTHLGRPTTKMRTESPAPTRKEPLDCVCHAQATMREMAAGNSTMRLKTLERQKSIM